MLGKQECDQQNLFRQPFGNVWENLNHKHASLAQQSHFQEFKEIIGKYIRYLFKNAYYRIYGGEKKL